MPTSPLTINWILYSLPVAELLVCAGVWLALAAREQVDRLPSFLVAFGGVWIVLVVIDFAVVTVLTPTMNWTASPLALSLFYPQIYVIAVVLLVRAIAQRKWPGRVPGWIYTGLVAGAQALGFAWTEGFRLVIASLAD